MARRALIDHRPWLLAAIICAAAYLYLRTGLSGEWPVVLLKGSGVVCLAIYAWTRGRGADAALLALVLLLSAFGDFGIERSLTLGTTAFALSHLVGTLLYIRNYRANPVASQVTAAIALFLIAPLVAWLLTQNWVVVAYSVPLGSMAATAWLSRFSRYRVGLGAVFLLVVNSLAFWNIGETGAQSIISWLIWPLYFVAQFLIATGVVQRLIAD